MRREIQMIPDAPHKEGTQWAMPNHLKRRFKSNKRKLMLGDASSAHTLNHFLTQALAQRNQSLTLGARGGEE
jgi:aminopeptidase C